MGVRASNTTEIILKDVKIPADHLLGKEGDGFKMAMKTLDKARRMYRSGHWRRPESTG
jgi:butyryl-CoA dehydrogenase